MAESMRILLVDGDDARRGKVMTAISSSIDGVELVEAFDEVSFERALESLCFDLVITDLHAGFIDVFGVIRATRMRWDRISIVVLATNGDEETAVKVMKAGADEYVKASGEAFIRLARIIRDAGRSAESILAQGMEASTLRFLENVPVGLYRTTEKGRVVYVNKALVEILGYSSASDLLRSSASTVYVDPEDRRRSMKTLEEKGIANTETRFRKRNGAVIWVRDTCRAVLDHDGGVLYYEGCIVDITEQKQAEEDLQRSEKQYRTLIQHQGEGLGIVDRNERFVFCNPVAEQIFGVPEGTLPGKSLQEFTTKEIFSYVLQQTDMRRKGERSTYEIEIVRPDGQSRSLLCTATPWPDKNGDYMGSFAIFRDITEQKAAVAALKLSEEKYRAVLFKSQDCIILVDRRTHRVLETNPALQELLQYTASEMEELGLSEFVHHSEEDIRDKIEKIASGQLNSPIERRYRKKDGTLVEMEMRGSLLTFSGKEVICVVSREITERKRAEEALRRSQEQLRQAQKLEAVGQLAGGVAHDFNNLMMGILMYCDLLLKKDLVSDPEKVCKEVTEIRAAADRAAALTRQLLAFSRRQSIQVRSMDLNEMVSGMEGLLRRLLGDRIELEIEGPPDPIEIQADQGQVEQVLLNLVLNSRDAIPLKGRVRVRIGSALLKRDEMPADDVDDAESGGRYAYLSVQDDGAGIPKEVKERIFEPFFTTKEPGKGTGLGLATVYGIVKQHNGWIDVQSIEGDGATFTVYLPYGLVGGNEILSERARAASGTVRTRVLLVEPHENERRQGAKALIEHGHEVVEAATAAGAESIISRDPAWIDILISSVKLPDRSGIQLADDLRSRNPASKVLLVGVYDEEQLELTAIPERGYGYLRKPFQPQKLVSAVEALLPHKDVAFVGA